MNIPSAAVGLPPTDGDEGAAVMVVTTDAPVPQRSSTRSSAGEGFLDGRTVALA